MTIRYDILQSHRASIADYERLLDVARSATGELETPDASSP